MCVDANHFFLVFFFFNFFFLFNFQGLLPTRLMVRSFADQWIVTKQPMLTALYA